jgi:O-antigen/teichoic acid export membrane protein
VVSVVRQNIIATFSAKAWTALVSLAFIPIYIGFLGIEAYGLVGVYLSLTALASVFDFGLGATLSRELAKLSAHMTKALEMRHLVRTLEIVYWTLALLIAVVIILSASSLANYWVNTVELSRETVYEAAAIMGVAIALQFPFFLYSGGLMGLQQHVLLSQIAISTATVRSVGAALVLWLVEPTIQAFFLWQILISIIQTAICGGALWFRLPKAIGPGRFNKNIFRGVWRFAAGMTGISMLSVVLMQTDKLILSKMLSLEIFGYYTLAAVVAGGLYVFYGAVFSALFPRLSQLVAAGDEDEIVRLYHKTSQILAAGILPIAIVVALFSKEILLLWTRDPIIAERTHSILSLLVVGNALGGLMNPPFALQLAHGWTRLALIQNAVAIVILVPLIFVLTNYYGAEGAASVWLLLNAGYVVIGIQFMHVKLIRNEKLRWYIEDLLVPALGPLGVGLIAYWLFPVEMSDAISVAVLILITALALLTATLSGKHTRRLLLHALDERGFHLA